MAVTLAKMAANAATIKVRVGEDVANITFYPGKLTDKLIEQLGEEGFAFCGIEIGQGELRGERVLGGKAEREALKIAKTLDGGARGYQEQHGDRDLASNQNPSQESAAPAGGNSASPLSEQISQILLHAQERGREAKRNGDGETDGTGEQQGEQVELDGGQPGDTGGSHANDYGNESARKQAASRGTGGG